MRLLATTLFAILFASLIGVMGAQVTITWMHRAHQLILRSTP